MTRPVRLLRFIALLLFVVLAPLTATAQGGVHVVQAGETLTAIALRYGTTVAELKQRNGLNGDLLQIGQRLTLPGPDGWRLQAAPTGTSWSELADAWSLPEEFLRAANPTVVAPAGRLLRVPPGVGVLATPQAGEDLIAFAARLGAAPGAIAERNGLAPPYAIVAGEPLLLPVDTIGAPSFAPAPSTPARGASTQDAVGGAEASEAPPSLDPRSHAALRDAALDRLGTALAGVRLEPPDDGFAWPLTGSPRVTSRFGWRAISVAGNRYHLGLDLGAPSGTPVVAARDGVVARQGWIGAYGYAVYLRHDDGFETRYAHLSRIEVTTGEAVQAGQRIGRVGTTGASTGPHLHFEVRLEGRALDPLELLPPASDGAASAN